MIAPSSSAGSCGLAEASSTVKPGGSDQARTVCSAQRVGSWVVPGGSKRSENGLSIVVLMTM